MIIVHGFTTELCAFGVPVSGQPVEDRIQPRFTSHPDFRVNTLPDQTQSTLLDNTSQVSGTRLRETYEQFVSERWTADRKPLWSAFQMNAFVLSLSTPTLPASQIALWRQH